MSTTDDGPLPEYPNNTAAFGRTMRRLQGNQGEIQSAVRSLVPEVDDLKALTYDELALVTRTIFETQLRNVAAVTASIDTELARRSAQVSEQTVSAISALNTSLDRLRRATDRWSLMLVAASLLLLVVALVQLLRS